MTIFIRRLCYRVGVFKVHNPQVPLVVIGNITVGGTGKTPLVIAVANYLKTSGWSPAIVSRGHGGADNEEARFVDRDDNADDVGDEPLLIARNTGLPVVVCRRRERAVALVTEKTQCNVVVSDDGLQYYGMHRDIEIVSVDSKRLFGNGFLLPAGPLRESMRKLQGADFVVSKGRCNLCTDSFSLMGDKLLSLSLPQQSMSLAELTGQRVNAVAGIADPDGFFSALRRAGVVPVEYIFADHHPYTKSDLQFDELLPIVMTEKDAVKCGNFQIQNAWYWPVEAQFENDFLQRLEARLSAIGKS